MNPIWPRSLRRNMDARRQSFRSHDVMKRSLTYCTRMAFSGGVGKCCKSCLGLPCQASELNGYWGRLTGSVTSMVIGLTFRRPTLGGLETQMDSGNVDRAASASLSLVSSSPWCL